MGILIVALYFIYLVFCESRKEGVMNTLLGVGCLVAVILLLSLFFTFCELMDRLDRSREEGKKVAIRSLFKYWPISIWSIYWNGIKDECRYGRVIPRPTENKGGQIEE